MHLGKIHALAREHKFATFYRIPDSGALDPYEIRRSVLEP